MSTRIRYNKNSDGSLVTRSPVIVGADAVNVLLIPSELSYLITDATNGTTIAKGNAISMQMLKIRVKKELRSRGAVFNDEVRSRE